MKKLFEMSVYSILIEGGGETNAYALDSGVVDEILCFIAPKIIGGALAKTSVEGKGVSNVAKALKVNKMALSNIGPDILIKGYTYNGIRT
jgi:diaminohydroxyphosphoribosylaminopyrimidine deaminase/5-amino-6-(5-phosphoribosylamino)uracil reductase